MNYSHNKLKIFCSKILVSVGVSQLNSEIVSRNLINADLRNIPSHGIARLPNYVKRIQLGLINPNPNVKVVNTSHATCLLDGDNCLGQIAAEKAILKAIEITQERGLSIVGVKNTNHIGIASSYVLKAAKKGMIGFCLANGSAHMAPWGGKTPILGTNPISIAIPAGRFNEIVLDMATSVTARGKIILAAEKGEKIPIGWALNKEGNPTNNPKEAMLGTILPLGGYKGFGLSLIVDILSGVLTGSSYGSKIPSMTENFSKKLNEGIFLGAFKVNNFIDIKLFEERIENYILEIKNSPTAPGVTEIFFPGELEHKAMKKNLEMGIKIDRNICKNLNILAEKLNIDEIL